MSSLFGEEMQQRMARARDMNDRGLVSATIRAATEPKVTKRVEPFPYPPPTHDVERQYGTEADWIAYMRHVHGAPPWAEVERDIDIDTRARHGRFVWWEIETWVEREERRA